MKILFVSDTYFPHYNGVYSFVRQIATQLKRGGDTVAVLAPSQTMRLTQTTTDGIDVFGVPSIPAVVYPIRIPIPFILYYQIRKILSEYSPDIIHVQSHFTIGKATITLSKQLGIPIIGTNHFMPENLTALLKTQRWTANIRSALYTSLARTFSRLDIVTAPTQTAAGLIRDKLSNDIRVISNGVDLHRFSLAPKRQFFRERYGIQDLPVLLFVGRMDPEKNLCQVLRAIAVALKSVDFYFVMAGKGVCTGDLEILAKKLTIDHRVILAGFVPDEELPSYYKLSTCFIMASTAELQSIATMEAMASGLPVIAVDAGALGELVHHQENGFLFNEGDLEGLAGCLTRMFGQADLKAMGEKSLEIINNHDIQRSAEAFQNAYHRAITLSFSKVDIVTNGTDGVHALS